MSCGGGIEGVVTGRALYDGRLDLADALRVAAERGRDLLSGRATVALPRPASGQGAPRSAPHQAAP